METEILQHTCSHRNYIVIDVWIRCHVLVVILRGLCMDDIIVFY